MIPSIIYLGPTYGILKKHLSNILAAHQQLHLKKEARVVLQGTTLRHLNLNKEQAHVVLQGKIPNKEAQLNLRNPSLFAHLKRL